MKHSIIISGLAGTLAMTLFIEAVSLIFKKRFHVVRILSRMLLRNDRSSRLKRYVAYGIAAVVHYTIGVLFTWLFHLLVNENLIYPITLHTVVFGSVAGLIGITGWRICFALHPNPPKIHLSQYLSVIWLGHLIFALVMLYTYIRLESAPDPMVVTVC